MAENCLQELEGHPLEVLKYLDVAFYRLPDVGHSFFARCSLRHASRQTRTFGNPPQSLGELLVSPRLQVRALLRRFLFQTPKLGQCSSVLLALVPVNPALLLRASDFPSGIRSTTRSCLWPAYRCSPLLVPQRGHRMNGGGPASGDVAGEKGGHAQA